MSAVEAAARVRISGATGNFADDINGEYVVAGEAVNGAPAFQKECDADRWLCRGTDGAWSGQRTQHKGTDPCYAYTARAVQWPWMEGTQWIAYMSRGDDDGNELQADMRVEAVGNAVEEIARRQLPVAPLQPSNGCQFNALFQNLKR